MNRLPNPNCVVKVGSGRGFVINHCADTETEQNPQARKTRYREFRLVVTAAHCLPKLPVATAYPDPNGRIYRSLLGRLGDDLASIPAECVFVDPVADIAVLGRPDDQVFETEPGAYDDFVNDLAALRIGEAKSGQGSMLTLDGKWSPITLDLHINFYGVGLEIDPTEAGQSGSPILNNEGHAVGIVAIGRQSNESAEATNERCGPQPILSRNLPGWLLGGVAVQS